MVIAMRLAIATSAPSGGARKLGYLANLEPPGFNRRWKAVNPQLTPISSSGPACPAPPDDG
jgi:hypothetical protein